MSVHGEYNRALDALLASVRQLGDSRTRVWIERLNRARPGPELDLSKAASLCLQVLQDIETNRSLPAEETSPLRAPFEHLRTHCRVVLGIPEGSKKTDDS